MKQNIMNTLTRYFIVVMMAHPIIGAAQLAPEQANEHHDQMASITMNNDISLLPISTQNRLNQLFNQYITNDRIYSARDTDKIEESGSGRTIQRQQEILVYKSNLLQDVRYRDDGKNGYDITFYTNGNINSYIEYKAGLLDGAFIKFFNTGKPNLFFECSKGKQLGAIMRWNESGELKESDVINTPQEFRINAN